MLNQLTVFHQSVGAAGGYTVPIPILVLLFSYLLDLIQSFLDTLLPEWLAVILETQSSK